MNTQKNVVAHDLLAQVRGIIIAFKSGGITYEQAKEKTSPLLQQYNTIGTQVAKKYGRKWYSVGFSTLARSL